MRYSYRFDGERSVNLRELDTKPPVEIDREAAEAQIVKLSAELGELQELMYGAGKHSLLVVLQGMDTSGKDGTIRHLASALNIQGVHVQGFKVPTPDELAHDFLWRVHPHVPAKGNISVFNRSHYEDVLVVRVHNLVPEDVWKRRYNQINEFEDLVAENRTQIVKIMLHISKAEQEERLLDREQEVEKSWKLSPGDWKERAFWEKYQDAYADAIGKCSSKNAPWFVVPADKKWYRNLAVSEILVEALRPLKPEWTQALKAIGSKAKAELEEYRRTAS